jgi:hypothetical protein
MDARDSFREMLREQVGPALRQEGFAGSGANWRRRNDAGDWGVVNFQKSAYGSAHSVDFYINLSLVVEPERQFSAWLNNRTVPKVPSALDDVWSIRPDPPPRQGRDRFDRWQFGDGAASRLIGAEVIETVLTVAMRSFQTLLNRKSLLELLEDMDGNMILGGALAHLDPQTLRAVILSDYGASKELTAALQHVTADARQHEIAGSETWAKTCRAVIEWVTARTAAVEPIAGT